MNFFKIFIITFFIIFSGLTSITHAETLKFGESTYEGEVKKGKAHGTGVFTFSDGSKYEGKVKKNRAHGKGKYTDSQGKVFEGKFRRGNFKNKIDKKTREIINLDVNKGISSKFEIKGKGKSASMWFEAEKNSSGTYELTTKGKREMEAVNSEEGGGGGGGCG